MNLLGAIVALAVLVLATPASAANVRSAGPGAPYAVGVRTETFVDTTRPTQENHGVAAQPSRTLVTTVFYPAIGQPGGPMVSDAPAATRRPGFPLVVFASGLNVPVSYFADFLSQLAVAGYVVAAPKFPLTGANVPGGQNEADFVNQPGDLSVVITRMLRMSRDKHSPYFKLVDTRRIGAVGASVGADTVVGLGYNTCCIDKRVRAIVSLSGNKRRWIRAAGRPTSYSYPSTPLLLIRGGDANADGAFPVSQQLFNEAHTPKFLLTVTHGTHIPIKPEDGPGGSAARQAVIDFLDVNLQHDARSLQRLQTDANVPGVASLQQAPTR